MTVDRIISGGQTGADRASLDFAITHGIRHGGWCPKGRRAEDGVIPERYLLQETPSREYSQRTEWNVRDSDATVIFTIGPTLTGRSRLTAECTREHGKPWLHLARAAPQHHCTAASDSRIRRQIPLPGPMPPIESLRHSTPPSSTPRARIAPAG